ncbi:hypothetical protein BC943DRAFT_354107 [Umbelopsis sp. AD052]|nr:hypothetical protein BC943DRAFT_354107 [Umbelopsis sp. AD052]
MDLKNMLHSGKQPLTIDTIVSLIDNADTSYKLDQITDATFAIPPNAEQCCHYFDQFLQLLASFDYQNPSDLEAHYTTSALVASLRACVNDILVSNGLMWLLSFPPQISDKTWSKLRTSPTILVYVYGLILAMGSQQQVSPALWVNVMSHFVKAATPYVSTHIWLSVYTRKSAEQEYLVMFLDAVESHYKASNVHMEEAWITMLSILERGMASVLQSTVNQYLGNVSVHPFSDQDLILGKIAFDRYLEKKSSSHLHKLAMEYERKRQEDIDTDMAGNDLPPSMFKRNPLITHKLMEPPPTSEAERTHLLEKPMAQWCYQLQTFSFKQFDFHLSQIIEKHYPNDRKTVLDLLLIEWIQRDEMEDYLETILSYIIACLKEQRYDKRASPFWAVLHLYSQSDSFQDESRPLYGEISGAQVDSGRDEVIGDDRRHRTCDRILQLLTDANVNNLLTPWINDILQVASSRVLAKYLEWMAQKIGSAPAGTDDHTGWYKQNKYYRQLNEVFKGEHIKHKADSVIPTLMRTQPMIFLDLVESRAYLNAMLKAYFSKPPEMAIELLVNDLLQSHSKEFMLQLFNVLGAQSKASSQWFSNHFLGPILCYETDTVQKQRPCRGIFQTIMSDSHFFPFLFFRIFDPSAKGLYMVDMPIRDTSLQLLKRHSILKPQMCGLLRLFEEIVRLQDPVRQHTVLELWKEAWGPELVESKPGWLLCCLLFFGHASAAVKQVIDGFLSHHIHALLTHQPELPTFIIQATDLALLSEIEDPEDVFTLLISHLLNSPDPQLAYDTVYVRQVLFQAVIILSETVDEIELLMEQERPTVPIAMEESDIAQPPRKKARKEMKKARMKKRRVGNPVSQPSDPSTTTDLHSLCLYSQRLVSIILTMLTSEGVRLMTPTLRQFITEYWAQSKDIYAPFVFLITLPSHMKGDRHITGNNHMAEDSRKIISLLRRSSGPSDIENIITTAAARHHIKL